MVKKIRKMLHGHWGYGIMSAAFGIVVALLLLSPRSLEAVLDSGAGIDHLPDLEALTVQVFPPNPTFESDIVVHAFLWNNSDIRVEGPIAINIGIEGIEAVERIIPVLNPWEAVPVEASFRPLVIDEYRAFVMADPGGDIPESREDNNRASTPFHVGPPVMLPDLTIIDMNVYPPEPTSEDDVVVEAMVWNDSEMEVEGPVAVNVRIDCEPVGAPIVIDHLFPREARRVSVVARPSEPGRHSAFMRVDPENLVRERREGNNNRAVQFDVLPPPPVSVSMIPTGEAVLPPDGVLLYESSLTNHTDETFYFPFRIVITRPGDDGFRLLMDEFDIELSPGDVWTEDMETVLPLDPPLEAGPYLLTGEAGDIDRDAFEFFVRPEPRVAQ